MPNIKTLQNPDLMHIVDYQDVELVKACGVSVASMARILGYTHQNGLYCRLKFYRLNARPFPLQVSTLIETALWRLGKMNVYISAKQRRDGRDGINWDRLPDHLEPWQ